MVRFLAGKFESVIWFIVMTSKSVQTIHFTKEDLKIAWLVAPAIIRIVI